MSELPRRLSPGTRLSAHWLNRLLDWLRSRDLRPGRGVKLTRTPSGTTISVDTATETPSEDPMPFDCRVEPNASGALRWRCYLPLARRGLVRIAHGARVVEPSFISAGGALGDDWYDLGAASKGDKITLYLVCSADADSDTERISSASWAPAKTKPPGQELGPLGPSVPVAEWTSNGVRQLFHGHYLFGASDPELDTDVAPDGGSYEPGESVDRFLASTASADGSGPVQLRQFHNTQDTLAIQPIGSTGEGPNARHFQLIVRQVSRGSGNMRPKLGYVSAAVGGPFWLRGANETANFGTALKLGNPTDGYITISTSA